MPRSAEYKTGIPFDGDRNLPVVLVMATAEFHRPLEFLRPLAGDDRIPILYIFLRTADQ